MDPNPFLAHWWFPMGKTGEERQPLPPSDEDHSQNADRECRCRCSRIRRLVGFRCILVLLLSVAVLLSAVFWLPPFLGLADQNNLLADSRYKGHDIVASFIVNKSVSLLEDNTFKLSNEIFDEIEAPSAKVAILSLDPLPGPNMTRVVFAVDPDGKDSEISSAALSLIRASFQSLVIRQSALQLTSSSLFGSPFSFEVLKFKGGITIIPQQTAFPLQAVHTLFNFTLNFPIDQIQSNFGELRSQLKSGLHLSSFENVNVILSNAEGSTIAAPTVVQSSVLLAIGITPSTERLKQLAKTITGPHNLGLNNTEFGRVQQVRLSSVLQHSLHGGDGSRSPFPAPLPHPSNRHHHHHQHHHHHHGRNPHLTPETSPIPAPVTGESATPPEIGSPPMAAKSAAAPHQSSQAQPPNCPYRMRSTHNAGKHAHRTRAIAPSVDPHHPVPVASPKPHVEPPAHVSHSVPALSPLSDVALAHAEPPPTKNGATAESPSSAGCVGTVTSILMLMIVLVV